MQMLLLTQVHINQSLQRNIWESEWAVREEKESYTLPINGLKLYLLFRNTLSDTDDI